MLPGLRFLFVAVVLSLSMMIFGLGAAALLRSAHEEFTNLPTMRPQPETILAQQTEVARPTLALLRVDTPVTEPNEINRPTVSDVPNAEPPQEQSSPTASTEPDRVTAEPDRTAAEPDRPATPTAALPSEEKSGAADTSPEAPAQAETTARIEMPTPPPENQAPETQKLETQRPETQVAAIPEPTSSAAVTATAAVSEPSAAPSAKAGSLKIATLGGPAVTIVAQTVPKKAVATPTKRKQARRPVKRHRIARVPAAPPPPAAVGLFGTLPGG
jgi:hypothetical protein